VVAVNAFGTSAPSNEVPISVGGACATVPSIPRNFSADVAGNRVAMRWDPPTGDCTPTGYRITAGVSPGSGSAASLTVGGTSTTVSAPNGRFYARVFAINGNGASGPSNEAIIVVGPSIPTPVNCVTSEWSAWSPTTAFSACVGGTQNRQEVRTRSVIVPPAHGGLACGPLVESRTFTQACVPAGELEIVQSTVTLTSDALGDALVVGQVTNNRQQAVTFPEVTATFRNTGGTAVGTDSTYVIGRSRRLSLSGIITDTSLAPGESGCFIMFTNIAAAGVATASLSIGFDTFAASNLDGSVVLSGAPTRSSSLGDLRLDGFVTNNGSRLTYFTQAAFLVKDTAGRALDCDTTYVNGTTVPLPSGVESTSGVPVGQTKPYTAFTRAPFGQDGVITGWTLWEEFASGSDSVIAHDTVSPEHSAAISQKDRAQQREERERALRRQLNPQERD
jgi:hypothetical protein